MKLKQTPDDFQVEELTAVRPRPGPFGLYRLEKRGWTTPDALNAVRRRWDIDHRRLSYGGLKDRHAATIQYFTIFHGPQRNLRHHDVDVIFVGTTDRPFISQDILANRFRITLRKMSQAAIDLAQQRAIRIAQYGIPNYFDDQRFGSTDGREFVGRLMVLGRYEDALKLALTAPYAQDKAAVREEKATLIRHWSQWRECKAALPRSHARSLVDYLVSHPTDFRGTVARMRPELQGLYLASYQSYLWNRMLARLIESVVPEERRTTLRLKLGDLPVATHLEGDEPTRLSAAIPLPSARLKPDPGATWEPLVEAALADQGFELSQMKLPGLRQPFFSRGERSGWVTPAGFVAEPGDDDRHPGHHRLALQFDLPRGSYATIVVKRLTQAEPTL